MDRAERRKGIAFVVSMKGVSSPEQKIRVYSCSSVAKPFLPPNIHRILVIRRDNIGDLICTTPLIRALRKRFPQARLDVLVNDYNAPVVTGNPDIDHVIAYTKAKHADTPKWPALWREWRIYRQLRRVRYDLLIHANPVNHPRTEKLARYLKPRYALGVSDSDASAYNLRLRPQDIRGVHHVERVFSLLVPLGIEGEPGPLFVPGRHRREPQTPPVLGIHISSRRPRNRWPLDHFTEVIRDRLAQGWRCRLFWAPGPGDDPRHPGDDERVQALLSDFPTGLEPMPTRRLETLIQGLADTDQVLCCDGGALHLAAGLGRPTVALFGCTDPKQWGLWGAPNRTLDGHGDAGNIPASQAIAALDELHRALTP